MKQVLFLGMGNSTTSQMAEGWANYLAMGSILAYSAGTNPLQSVDPRTIDVMNEKGIDISRHVTKTLIDVIQPIHLIVAICSEAANCPVLPPDTPVERWDISDPVHSEGTPKEIREAFRKCRNETEMRVVDLLSRLSVGGGDAERFRMGRERPVLHS